MRNIVVSYLGNFLPEFSTENDVKKALEHLGHIVIPIQENAVSVQQIAQQAFKSDLLLFTGTWGEILPLHQMLDLFQECAKRGIPTATLHLDTFWSTKRQGRRWWTEPMFHTGYIFTADGDYQKEWELFGKNHHWLPPAIRHDAVGKGERRPEYLCDVAFVGSNGFGYHEDVWPYRKQLVRTLRSMAAKNGWAFKNPGGFDGKIDRDSNLNDFYASAKVVVGDSLCLKKEESQYFSDRLFESWGRGAFLIMPQIDCINEMLNQPTYKWGDFLDLENKIKYWLSNEEERNSIRDENLETVKEKHTYVNRVQEMLDIIFK
jgi:hypothetical protein